jgi:hypothetical protein
MIENKVTPQELRGIFNNSKAPKEFVDALEIAMERSLVFHNDTAIHLNEINETDDEPSFSIPTYFTLDMLNEEQPYNNFTLEDKSVEFEEDFMEIMELRGYLLEEYEGAYRIYFDFDAGVMSKTRKIYMNLTSNKFARVSEIIYDKLTKEAENKNREIMLLFGRPDDELPELTFREFWSLQKYFIAEGFEGLYDNKKSIHRHNIGGLTIKF